MIETTEKLTAADGFVLEAFRAAPKQGKKGGLVILQEIFGLTDQLKGVVRAYARDGYDTIIPAVYDRVAPGTVVPFNEPDRGRDMAYGLPLDKVMLDIAAAVDCVQGPHGVSILGFCWGGGVIIRAAAELNLRGAIAFYGTRLPTYLDQKPKCPLLFHFAKTDPNSTPEIIEQVRKAFPVGRNAYLRSRPRLRQRRPPGLCAGRGRAGAQPHASSSSPSSIKPPAEPPASQARDRSP